MRRIGTTLAMALGLLLTQAAYAQHGCGPTQDACCGAPDNCAHCGGHAACKKMCKVVCEIKEVKKVVWTVKCEEFCTPLPGCKRCHACGDNGACGECGGCDAGCDAGCGKPKMVPPQCGPVRSRKVLVPKEVVERVPVYKCVPCYACGACCESGAVQPLPADPKAPVTAPAPAPKAPQAPAKQPSTGTAPLPPLTGASYSLYE